MTVVAGSSWPGWSCRDRWGIGVERERVEVAGEAVDEVQRFVRAERVLLVDELDLARPERRPGRGLLGLDDVRLGARARAWPRTDG